MKKVLSTVAALGLVAGLASNAAAVEFSLKGKYVVEGYYLSDSMGTVAGADLAGPSDTDAYWMHTFQLLPTMKVNDKISMSADIRIFKEAMWGGSSTSNPPSDDGYQDLDFDKIWMDYQSPIGKFRVGRVETNTFGGSFINSAASGNRVMFWPAFMPKPWELLVFTQKTTEGDAATSDTLSASDADRDAYKAMLSHTSDAGKAAIEYIYDRNATGATVNGSGEENTVGSQHVGIWGKYKVLGNWTLEAELAYKFGDAAALAVQRDWDALAGMFDVTGQFGALDAGLMYFYASGDDNPNDSDNEAAMSAYQGTGDDFKPLYILTGDHTGILNDDLADFTPDAQYPGVAAAGVHAVVLHAGYKVSDKLSLSGAVAYAQADQELAGYDDEYGWEYNVGAAYKLLDNLTYEAHFGFLDTGDFFKQGTAVETNDITLMSHHLTMSF